MGKLRQMPKCRAVFEDPITAWGDIVTADHLDCNSGINITWDGDRWAVVTKDIWSKLQSVYPILDLHNYL